MVKRRRRATRRPSAKRNNKLGRRLEHGFQIKGKSDPPSFTLSPWWNMTVYIAVVGNQKVTLNLIVDTIKAQLPGIKSGTFDFKVSSIRAWALGEGISLDIYDISRFTVSSKDSPDVAFPKHEVIAELLDTPGKAAWAHVGWRFGTIHSNVVQSSSETTYNGKVAVAQLDASGSTKSLIYVSVQIRMQGSQYAKQVNRSIVLGKAPASDNDFQMI